MALLEKLLVEVAKVGIRALEKMPEVRQIVYQVRKKLDSFPKKLLPDFDGIYDYTFSEYSEGKPKPLIEFFREDEIRSAFKESFYEGDVSILRRQTEKVIDRYLVGDSLRKIEIGIEQIEAECDEFGIIFLTVVYHGLPPGDALAHLKLNEILGILKKDKPKVERKFRLFNVPGTYGGHRPPFLLLHEIAAGTAALRGFPKMQGE